MQTTFSKDVEDEVKALIESKPIEDLEKRFFKNFGCINFKPDWFMHERELADCFHKYHEKLHPEKHKHYMDEPYRCYHVEGCMCGLEYAWDSSD